MLIGDTFPATLGSAFFDRIDRVGYSERGRYCTTFCCALPLKPVRCSQNSRIYARVILACGSMVLYLTCRSFFPPTVQKNDLQRIENAWRAKVLVGSFFALWAKKEP